MTHEGTMTTNDQHPLYRDPSASTADRVADLLARMSIDEKLGQLGSAWVFQLATPTGFDAGRATAAARRRHRPRHSRVRRQRLHRRPRRRPSPTSSSGTSSSTPGSASRPIIHEEICAGLMAREATVFPQAIGVAATFRPELNADLADAVRLQMRSIGAHHGLSPVLDICRDPRWGRLEETYGEDPHLVTRMGIAYIRGLQGDDLARRCGRHRQALRRIRRFRRRAQLGAGPPHRTRAARRLPAAVRGCGARGRAAAR